MQESSESAPQSTYDEPMPSHLNVAAYCLLDNVRRHQDKEALRFVRDSDIERYTFGEVAVEVMRLADAFLAAGAGPGDRILLRLPHAPSFAFGFFAACVAESIAVPISPQWTAGEVDWLIQDTTAGLLCHTTGMALPEDVGTPRLDLTEWTRQEKPTPAAIGRVQQRLEALRTQPETPAYLVYTSGTTGRPKGVLHGHRSVWGRRPMLRDWSGMCASDVVLHAGQLNWTYTMGVGLLDPWAVGATAVLCETHREPSRWPQIIEEQEITLFAAVPSVYRQILKYTHDLKGRCGSLRYGLTAGEALRPSLHARWHDAVGTPLYEALGMSECSTYISQGPTHPLREGSPGRPQRGRRVAILPVDKGTTPLPPGELGLIAIHRSEPGLMLGYWQRPDEEAEVYRGEWFIGGDLGHIDEDGYIWFHGRRDDLMNAFGHRVSPQEIEAVVETHPGVKEAAVTAIDVRDDVSVMTAFVVPHPDQPMAALEEALRGWCQEHLAAYKCPRQYYIVDALPHTATGKRQRSALADLID